MDLYGAKPLLRADVVDVLDARGRRYGNWKSRRTMMMMVVVVIRGEGGWSDAQADIEEDTGRVKSCVHRRMPLPYSIVDKAMC